MTNLQQQEGSSLWMAVWNGPGLVPAVYWPLILEGYFPFHALIVYKRNDKKHTVCRIRPDGDTVTVATVSIMGLNGFLPLSWLQGVQMPEGGWIW